MAGKSAVSKCVVCRKHVKNGVQCGDCKNVFHFSCSLFRLEECVGDDWRCSSCSKKREKSNIAEKDAIIQSLRKELEEEKERVKRLMLENDELKVRINSNENNWAKVLAAGKLKKGPRGDETCVGRGCGPPKLECVTSEKADDGKLISCVRGEFDKKQEGGTYSCDEGSGLRVLQVNCRSIYNKREKFSSLVDACRPDIILGTESWLTGDIYSSEVFPPDFEVYRRDRGSRGGGVFACISNKLHSSLEWVRDDCEMLGVKIVNPLNKRTLQVIIAYRKPSDDLHILDILNEISIRGTSNNLMLIAGDLNLPDVCWEGNAAGGGRAQELVNNIIREGGLAQVVELPTRASNTLDVFLLRPLDSLISTNVMPGISDHDAVELTVNWDICKRASNKDDFKVFQYSKADSLGFQEHLSQNFSEWASKGGSIEEMWQGLKKVIYSGLDKYVPKKLIKNNSDPEYYNSKIRSLKRRVRVAHKRKNLSPACLEKYKRLIKELATEKVRAEEEYISKTLNSGNQNEFYKYLRRRRGDRNSIKTIKTDEGENLTREEDIAEAFSNWFSLVFNKGRDSIGDRMKGNEMSGREDGLYNYIEISDSDIIKKIRKLKNKKSMGPDRISSDAIKLGDRAIVPYLRTIFVAALNNKSIPDDWRKAVVIPIHKRGPKTSVDNYRPISLTSQIGKLMEKIIADYLRVFWKESDWLCKRQHGFRAGYSCETQLLGLIQDITESIDNRYEVDAVVIDFAKAFDKVSHNLLLEKIRRLNIDHRVTHWIENFLKNRKQRVKIGNVFSDEIEVTSGIPQGSVLGPLLFLIYINDMPNLIESDVRLFADDCIIYKRITRVSDREILQKDLEQLVQWTKANSMSINVRKSKHINFSRKKSKEPNHYTMNGETIPVVSHCKYLGVNLSKNLKWDRHIEDVISKAYRSLHFAMRNLKRSGRGVKERAYKSLVRPIVEYATSVWDPHETGLIKKLEGMQRKAARYVMGKHQREESVSEMLRKLEWESLESRRRLNRLAGIFKAWKDEEGWEEMRARLNAPNYIGRGDHNLKIKEREQKTDIEKYSFINRGIRDWNALPGELLMPMPKNVKLFKSRIKNYDK